MTMITILLLIVAVSTRQTKAHGQYNVDSPTDSIFGFFNKIFGKLPLHDDGRREDADGDHVAKRMFPNSFGFNPHARTRFSVFD